jgi:hypothetical protein
MARRPQGKVRRLWDDRLAYAIGLLATDGNLSPDGRHIGFTTKDLELAALYKKCLEIDNVIGRKARGNSAEKKYFVVQFGDVLFYRFLESIGLTSRKSKTIGSLFLPRHLFYDFLRGCIDGDGNIHAFMHPESRHPQLRVRIYSASKPFLEWILRTTKEDGVNGYIINGKGAFVLSYAIGASLQLFDRIYHRNFGGLALSRKYLVAKKFMRA